MKKANIGGKPVQLNDGEKIIWKGQPVQGVLRNPAHIISGVVLLALGIWLIFGGDAMRYNTSTIFGLLLALAGGYVAYFHAIVEKNRRADTFYAITNQRAIFAYSLRVLAYPISPNSRIELKNGRYDTVIIAANRQIGASQSTIPRSFGFGHLENGQEVYDLMIDIKEGSGHGARH